MWLKLWGFRFSADWGTETVQNMGTETKKTQRLSLAYQALMVVSIHLKHIRQLGSFLQGFKVNTKKICELPPTIYKYHSLKPWGEHKIYVHIVVKPPKTAVFYPQVTPCAMATIKVLKRLRETVVGLGKRFGAIYTPGRLTAGIWQYGPPGRGRSFFRTIIFRWTNF